MKKAMILAAGLGSRLQEITANKPKALVEVAGRPVIDHVIRKINKAGINEIIVNLHYYPQQIKDYIESQNYACKFTYSYEPELLDTGGAIKKAQNLLKDSESFLLHNCDVLTDFDLLKLIREQELNKSLATMAVSKNKSPRFLWFTPEMKFAGWEVKTTNYREVYSEENNLLPYDFNCMTVFSTKIFSYFAKLPNKFSIFNLMLLAIKEQKIIRGLDIGESYWIDIGTPEDLAKANQYFRN